MYHHLSSEGIVDGRIFLPVYNEIPRHIRSLVDWVRRGQVSGRVDARHTTERGPGILLRVDARHTTK